MSPPSRPTRSRLRAPRVVQILWPFLRMDDDAPEPVHSSPLRRIALRVAVIALAHPKKIAGETGKFAGVESDRIDRPRVVRTRPRSRSDPVAVADVPRKAVLVDNLAHVAQDLFRCGDRGAGPRLEAVAEGVEVAVGADAGIAMRAPSAAKAFLLLEHDKARTAALVRQVIGAADTGNPGANDQHVEMLGRLRRHRRGHRGISR